MTRDRSNAGLNPVLVTITAVVVLSTIAMAGVTAGAAQAESQENPESGSYSVVQGGECIQIESLGNGLQTVEDFYDYRTPESEPEGYMYSSHGTTHLQEPNTSILFLYEGRDGLGLMIVHGSLEGYSAGGVASMEITGLPADGEWVVEDDSYGEDIEESPDDIFLHDGTESRIAWAYSENRTDGAAFRGGLEDGFEIEIDPRFNDVVDFAPSPTEGESEISDWQVISSSDDGHERTSLDLNEPITISSSPCTDYSVTELTTVEETGVGESFEVEATVRNDGAQSKTFTVAFTVEGDTVDEQEVTLDAGEETTVTTQVSFDETGTYTVGAGGATTDVTVTDDGGSTSSPTERWAVLSDVNVDRDLLIGAGALGGAVLLGLAFVVRRRLG